MEFVLKYSNDSSYLAILFNFKTSSYGTVNTQFMNAPS